MGTLPFIFWPHGANWIKVALRRSFFWPRVGEDVCRWARECQSCCENKAKPEIRAALQPVISSYPLEMVAIDFFSLWPAPMALSLSAGDDQSLLQIQLGQAHQGPYGSHDSTGNLIQTWVCPERILSDQGPAFESAVLRQLCALYGCKKIHTTPYHPQGNCACEWFNQGP